MTDKERPGTGFEVNIRSGASSKSNARLQSHSNDPFHIAVLGDFSASSEKPDNTPIASRRFIEVDRDNFEEVLAAAKISFVIDLSGEQVRIDIKELEDFHPDQLYESVETFSRLRSLRRRLKNNKTFAEAASEIQGWSIEAENQASQSGDDTELPVVETENEELLPAGNLLDNILESQQVQSTGTVSSERAQIDKLIRSIVAPYVEPAADPRQDEMLAMVDKATEKHMRDILHHPDFQAMESAWQSIYFLVRRLDTGPRLKIMLFDISKQELQADLAVDDVSRSAMYRKLCDVAQGDKPWSLLLGNYTFTDTIDDVLSLANIGIIAQQAEAPFVAAASERMVGCESFSSTPDYEDWNYVMSDGVNEAWKMVRQAQSSAYIGLAMPRFLLRLPYGRKGKPVEAFAFEEMPEEHCHECYLWGNAAFIKAEMLARNFSESGWAMQLNQVYQTDGLPLAFYTEDSETQTKPAAEIYLTEKGGEIISSQGMISLWSVKNADVIRSAAYCSINESAVPLSGRWA